MSLSEISSKGAIGQMDFAIKEWLTVIIVLLIVAVVLDGLRRVRQSRRNAIKMSLSMHQGISKDDLDPYGSELPNGGARVTTRRDENRASKVNQTVRQSKEPRPRKSSIPEQVTLNLDESVPMLMESVEESHSSSMSGDDLDDVLMHGVSGTHGRVEPTLSDYDEELEESLDASSTQQSVVEKPADDGVEESLDEVVQESYLESAQNSAQDSTQSNAQASPDATLAEAERADIPEKRERKPLTNPFKGFGQNTEAADVEPSPKRADTGKKAAEPSYQQVEPEEVLIINVMAKSGTYFSGAALLECLIENGMRYGAMNIFHCHLEHDGSGPVLFSLANIVMPGTFDLQAMDDFHTPGVSIFMTLPVEAESIPAFETMLSVAQSLADTLGGEMKDDSRSVMTQQTIGHYRQRVKDFERRRLSLAQ